MGIYTQHWDQHKKDIKKNLLVMLLFFVVGLPLAALLCYLLNLVLPDQIGWLLIAPFVIWLVAFTWFAIRSSKVICPRCNTQYSRGKYLCNCPKCDLRMLQENP
jgi:hypothetical protein